MPAVSSSTFKGKIGGVPKPVVLLVVAVAAFFLFRKLRSAGSTTSTSAGTNATPTSADNTQYPTTPSDSTGGGAGAVQAPDLTSLLESLGALQGGLQNAATGAPSTYNYYYYNTSTPGMDQAGGGNVTSTATTGATTSTQPATSYTPTGQIASLSNVQRQALDMVNAGVPITGSTAGGQMFTVPTLTATNLQNAAVRSDLGKAVGNVTPVSVKATPNKTGVSANAKQGVFAIH